MLYRHVLLLNFHYLNSLSENFCLLSIRIGVKDKKTQSRTNGPINAHLNIAQVYPGHNNENQEALL